MIAKPRTNIVWNVTRLCPFACSFCCVSAVYVRDFRQVEIEDDNTPVLDGELSFNQQIDIINQMAPEDFKVDFSGGDVLINPRNIDLILYASAKFGPDNIGLSLPGTFLNQEVLKKLSGKVADVEITLDNLPYIKDSSRPLDYPKIAAESVKKFVEYGFTVGVQTVLKQVNMNRETLKNLLNLLVTLGVQRWSLLKFFPVGRYFKKFDYAPSDQAYRETTALIQELIQKYPIEAHFQYLMPRYDMQNFRCRAVTKSIGILPSGKISACFWALGKHGEPLPEFVLGKLPEENIYNILNSGRANYWREQAETVNNCELLKNIEKFGG